MAVLDLLFEVAADAPLLVVAEDAHWLDRPSPVARRPSPVARRLESDPILLLAAVRDGFWSSLVGAGLPEHRLGALDQPSRRNCWAPQPGNSRRRRATGS
jgi:hypothetical protein